MNTSLQLKKKENLVTVLMLSWQISRIRICKIRHRLLGLIAASKEPEMANILFKTKSHDPTFCSDGGLQSVPASQRLPRKEIHGMTLHGPNAFSTPENITVPQHSSSSSLPLFTWKEGRKHGLVKTPTTQQKRT